MKKILISGLGGSLFPDLHNALKDKYELYYVDSNVVLEAIYPGYRFTKAPSVLSASYFDLIRSIVLKNEIDAYLPLIDEEIESAIVQFGDEIKVIAPSFEFARLCLNKNLLMFKLANEGISAIKSFVASQYNGELEFPIFLKPIIGRGSRGIFKALNEAQYKAYFVLHDQYAKSEILVQEYVGGTEYTVGVLTNNLNQLMSISVKKVISKKGITQHAVVENSLLIEGVVEKIIELLKPCGPFNVQLFLTEHGEVKIFEINPRFSTTTIMSFASGIDEVSLFLDNYNRNYAGAILRPRDGISLYRRWENVFYNV